MAKFYNNRVKTGKLAGSVFAVRFGETIERAYQPVVANPRTLSQTASRAKLKLLSQFSAILGPVIAIPRKGALSPRNSFTAVNYPLASYEDNEASVDLASVQLTSSAVGLPDVTCTRGSSNFECSLGSTSPNDLDKVVYVLCAIDDNNRVRLVSTTLVSEKGPNNTFPTTFNAFPQSCVVYAYGIRNNSDKATVVFGNLEASTAEAVAKLIVTRTLSETDVTLTETRGVLVPTV